MLSRRSGGRRLAFERLEDRQLLAVFTVMNLGDAPVTMAGDAPGTLRQAIFDANQTTESDDIVFAAGLSGPIALSSLDDASLGSSALLVDSAITIQGNTAGVTISRSASMAARLFLVTSEGDLTLRSLTLSGGLAEGASGELGRGGAVYVAGGALAVIDSTLNSNTARGGGDNNPGQGGAVFSDGGNVTIRNSTFSGNATRNGLDAPAGWGASVYTLNGDLTIANSTLTNNTGTAGRGVYVIADGANASVRIYDSIVGQADAEAQTTEFAAAEDNGGIIARSGSHNIIRTANSLDGFTNTLTGDPLLADLAPNGGPTWTHASLEGSPAIDAGRPAFDPSDPDGNPLTLDATPNDQRGAPNGRIADGDGQDGQRVDIGAYELQMSAMPPELPGDYNGDRTVDAADFTIWRDTMGKNVPRFSGADGDGSGWIDEPDYDTWKQYFGQSLPPQDPGGGAFESAAASMPVTVESLAPTQPANYFRAGILPFEDPTASSSSARNAANQGKNGNNSVTRSNGMDRSAVERLSLPARCAAEAAWRDSQVAGLEGEAPSNMPATGERDQQIRHQLLPVTAFDTALGQWPGV